MPGLLHPENATANGQILKLCLMTGVVELRVWHCGAFLRATSLFSPISAFSISSGSPRKALF